MTAFKELLIGGYVLRFWPSDNGWICGITESMMDALAQQTNPPQRTWTGLTEEDEIPWDGVDAKSFARAIEAKLKEKNT